MHWLPRSAPGDLKKAGAEQRLASTGTELLRQVPWPEKAQLHSSVRGDCWVKNKADRLSLTSWLPAWGKEWHSLKHIQGRQFYLVHKTKQLIWYCKKMHRSQKLSQSLVHAQITLSSVGRRRGMDIFETTSSYNKTKLQSLLFVNSTQPATSSWGVLTCSSEA